MLLWREYIVHNFVPVIATSLMFWASSRRMILFCRFFFVVLWSFGPLVLWPGGSPLWGLFTRLTGKSQHLQFLKECECCNLQLLELLNGYKHQKLYTAVSGS